MTLVWCNEYSFHLIEVLFVVIQKKNHYFAYLSFHLVGFSHCSMAQAGFRPSVHGAWVREAAVIDSGAELRRVGGLA